MYTVQALWIMAQEKADVAMVVMKNDNYGILEYRIGQGSRGRAQRENALDDAP
jgi:thiamine pyrophosphate-dependent acetolactate synthase large subunit-like protein